MKNNFNYNKVIKKLSIKKSDKIIINSNFLNIMIMAKKKNLNFSYGKFIDGICSILGKKGTLLIPSYSWEFINKKKFFYETSKSISGSLANKLLNRQDFKRTMNPIYSFLVKGHDQKKLCSMKHDDSFSMNSPFGYLISNNGKNIFIDIDYKDSFTFVHLAEQHAGVKYRYKKKFKGIFYKNKTKKNLAVTVYARKLSTRVKGTKIDKRFDNILLKNKALKKIKVQGINCQIIDVKIAYRLMLKSIRLKDKIIYPIY